MGQQRLSMRPQSWVVWAGREDLPGAPLNVAPVLASNNVHGDGRSYARTDGTPTWEALERVVGGLEGGKAVAFASGMAAIAAVFEQLPVGALVVIPDDCYQGVAKLAERGARLGRWTVRRVAGEDTAQWIRMCSVADLVWLESPSNPRLIVADLEAICAAPRKTGTIVAVDNTFATPLNQQPLRLGATVSVQSATKFMGGHSDLLAGVISTQDERLWQALRVARELSGATPGALEAYLAVRGARTLALRLKQAQQNAMFLAERLERHPLVARVLYPGSPSHPTHATARRLLRGFGSVITFEVRGGADCAERVCRSVTLIRHATSLGGVESTIQRRAGFPGHEHRLPSMLRLSVGIEDPEDLWADLDGAIRSAASESGTGIGGL